MNELKLDLTPEEITGIASFLGYGRTSAPVWFVGFEEGLGNMNSEDAAQNCRARGTFEDVMDLYEAHLRLLQEGQPIDIEKKLPRTPVWRFMAKIMIAREGHSHWHEPNAFKDYVKFCLGRRGGNTFVTELSPIPEGRARDLRWKTELAKLDNNLIDKIEKRRKTLKQLLRASDPPLVICYGRGRSREFEELLDIKWDPVSEKISRSGDSKCLLLPFFGNGQMSGSVIKELINRKFLTR